MERKPDRLGTEYYKSFLSEQGQTFYDRIYTQLLKRDYSGRTDLLISNAKTAVEDCFAAYKAIRDDHPEYFFLGYQSEFVHSDRSGTLSYPILYPTAIIERVQKQLRKNIYRLVRGTANLQMIDREILVYERIASKLAYIDNNDVRDHNVVGPVLLSSGVCEGHNALLLLCFRRIGIPCIKTYGKTKKGTWHCWTIAWIDGSPVHCDVTWESKEDGVVCFDYLNLSDEQIAKDHYEFRGPKTPVCKPNHLSYYDRHRLCVNSFNELRTRLKKDLSAGASLSLIHFNYKPVHGDHLKEVKKAFSIEQICGRHVMYYHSRHNNMVIKKIQN